MKYIFLTIDLEEWYDLDYLKNYHLDKSTKTIPEIINFLDLLDKHEVNATFFVLANKVNDNLDIIQEISRRGHSIGSHGLNHELLYNKNDETYSTEIEKSKLILEETIGKEIKGYRAACFSMERNKLEITSNSGFQYDSSYINFSQHPLYRKIDLTGFRKVDDLIYRNGNFFEYEIPTLKLGNFNLPISGGGYLRLFPYWLLKLLFTQYFKHHDNFNIYLHPFELTDKKLKFPETLPIKQKIRANIGRKNNLKKIEKIILYFKERDAQFRTFEEDIKERDLI